MKRATIASKTIINMATGPCDGLRKVSVPNMKCCAGSIGIAAYPNVAKTGASGLMMSNKNLAPEKMK